MAAGDAVAVVPEGLVGDPGRGAAPRRSLSEILVAGPREGAAAAAYVDAVRASPRPPLRLAA